MLTHKIKVALACLLLAAGVVAIFSFGWQVRDWQHGEAERVRLEAERKTTGLLVELAEEIGARTEVAISGIRIENKTIHQKATHEVKTNTVYADCRLPDAGRVLVNDARASANARGGTVSAPAASP